MTLGEQALIDVLKRHGPLPNPYTYALTKDACRDVDGHRKRLLKLVRKGHLERPISLNNPLVIGDYKIHAVADKTGKEYASVMAPHMLMTACITANVELGCKEKGYRFISREEIIGQAPLATQREAHPLALPTKIENNKRRSDRATEPDQLFGIDYGGTFWFYAVEADRGTEQLVASTLHKNTIERKLLAYDYILKQKIYDKHLGLPTLRVLFVTTNEERCKNMIQLGEKLFDRGSRNILFTWIPGFNPYFKSPPLFPQLWDGEWIRVKNNSVTIDEV